LFNVVASTIRTFAGFKEAGLQIKRVNIFDDQCFDCDI